MVHTMFIKKWNTGIVILDCIFLKILINSYFHPMWLYQVLSEILPSSCQTAQRALQCPHGENKIVWLQMCLL